MKPLQGSTQVEQFQQSAEKVGKEHRAQETSTGDKQETRGD